ALIANLTYADVSNTPTAARTLTLSLRDGDGAPLPATGPLALSELTFGNNPFVGYDFGNNSALTVTRFDADGFTDLVIRADGVLRLLSGDGSAWIETFGGSEPFSNLTLPSNAAYLSFDADGDGDLDIVHRSGGTLLALENDGFGNLTANPSLGEMATLNGVNVTTGARNMIFADVSAALQREIVIGNNNGTISVLAWNGSAYALVAAGSNPFNGITAGTNAAPAFWDFDTDGDQDMLLGLGDGTIRYYRNDAGTYVQQTGANNPLNGIDVGTNAAPVFVDRTGDGSFDVVLIGAANGQIRTWANTTLTSLAITVNVTAQGEVFNDAFSLLENGRVNGDVTADNGFGADGAGQPVTHINGQALTPGVAVVLPSGALLTMNVGGTFSYDPNHRYDGLGAPASGAANTAATDSFTYTAGGTTATVTLSITGVDSNNDSLVGDGGPNLIDGGLGNDRIEGLANNDILSGGVGGDTVLGGDGQDTLNGDDGADKLYGEAGHDQLNGGLGNDRMDGGEGTDTLTGGEGNDYLDGGSDNDILIGGLGNDVFIVGAGDQTLEAADEGYDIVRTELTWTLAANIEGLELQGAGDVDGFGNAGANNLQGNAGANTLSGLGGVDTINGNDGDDVIVGGLGNDLLRGGLGGDTFVVAHAFGAVLETDQIYDFNAPEGDILDLSGAFVGTLSLVAGFSKVAGQMTVTFAGGLTTVRLDTTGDGKVDYQVKINGDVTGETGSWLL
ncbi:MAG: hemagglutinin/hemolysin-like protein, partial [Caulobacter sp.]|nr:hemagglutinin/hemolysin-like protein [Caulobacter sp.]